MSEKKTERYSLISVYSRSSKSTISMLRVKEIKILFFFFVGKFYSKRLNSHMMMMDYWIIGLYTGYSSFHYHTHSLVL